MSHILYAFDMPPLQLYLMNNPNFYVEGGVAGEGDDVVEYYSDAGHGGNVPYDYCSQTGIMLILNGAPVYWASKKQAQGVSYSSAMSEIYALSETVRAARLHAWMCDEMMVSINLPLVVQVDNSQAISFQRGTCLNSRLRGIVDMRKAWVIELKEKGDVQVKHVEGDQQKADVLTKAMKNYVFQQKLRQLRGQSHKGDVEAFLMMVKE